MAVAYPTNPCDNCNQSVDPAAPQPAAGLRLCPACAAEQLAEKVGLVVAYTVGFTPAERQEIAAAILANGSNVWHEANAFANRRDGTARPCNCGRCKPRGPLVGRAVAGVFSVAGAASDGAPG